MPLNMPPCSDPDAATGIRVNGNELLLYTLADRREFSKAGAAWSGLCWRGGVRRYDGIALVAATSDALLFRFFNPDGSPERLCINALLGLGSVGELRRHLRVRLAPGLRRDLFLDASASSVCLRISKPAQSAHRPVRLGALHGHLYELGTPHAVFRVKTLRRAKLERLGPLCTSMLRANLTVYSCVGNNARARTFERGVEAETLSCGTGALAVALDARLTGVPLTVAFVGGAYRVWIGAKRSPKAVVSINRESVRSCLL